MTRITPLLFALFSLSVFADPPRPDEARLRELIAQLDDNDASKRDSASQALVDAPEAAVPLLEAAAKDGTPEVRGRAAQILHDRKVMAVLRKPQYAKLRETMDDAMSADPKVRRTALRSWVDGLARTPETIDALAQMAAVDPLAAGGAANEALNWLAAPRVTAKLSAMQCAFSTTLRPVDEVLGDLLMMMDVQVRVSDGAKDIVAANQVQTGGQGWTNGLPALDQVRMLATAGGVAYRFDDDTNSVVLETPEDSGKHWAAWWKTLRQDEIALMDLGIVKLADGTRLAKEQLPKWLDALESGDLRRARAARNVLKDIPDALFPEVARRAKTGARAAVDFNDRLALRKSARIAYVAARDGKAGLFVSNLDGSGEKKISGDLEKVVFPSAALDGSAVFAVSPDKDGANWVWKLDTEGKAPPARLAACGNIALVNGKGTWAATLKFGGPMGVQDLAGGDPQEFGGVPIFLPCWTADAKKLAWPCRQNKSFWVFDTATKSAKEVADCRLSTEPLAWSPDGSSVALVVQDHEDGAAYDTWVMHVAVADAATGKFRNVGEPHRHISALCWSPDGKRVAFQSQDGEAAKCLRKVEAMDVSTGASVAVDNPYAPGGNMAKLLWTPDGREIVFSLFDEGGKAWLVDPAARTSREIVPVSGAAAWIPGLDWMLDLKESLRLVSRDGKRMLPIVESPGGISWPMILPAKKK